MPIEMSLDVLDFDRAEPVALKRGGDLLLGPAPPSRGFAQRLFEERPVEQQAILRSSHRFRSSASKRRRPAEALLICLRVEPRKRAQVDQSSFVTATSLTAWILASIGLCRRA